MKCKDCCNFNNGFCDETNEVQPEDSCCDGFYSEVRALEDFKQQLIKELG